MRHLPRALVAVVAVAAVVAIVAVGCGRGDDRTSDTTPSIGVKGDHDEAAGELGFPRFATKNTTRIGGADSIADAAGVAQAVFPASSPGTRPGAVALVDVKDWRTAIAASVLMSAPVRAPLLYAEGTTLPAATQDALRRLNPPGSRPAAGAQVIRVGNVPQVEGRRSTDLRGRDTFALVRAIDAFHAAARGSSSDRVVIASADDPAYAMPAAAWAAKSGDPVLFVRRDAIPADTRAALTAHQQPKIYVLGPTTVISPRVGRELRRLGTVTRIAGPDPVSNAIAFARFAEAGFGWGIVDPGHGFVFADPDRPADAGAAAPLSASGAYGPLLLTDPAGRLTPPLESFLLDVQPGYVKDPVRGVYNRGWIVGDESTIPVAVQSQIDALLEIVPVTERATRKP